MDAKIQVLVGIIFVDLWYDCCKFVCDIQHVPQSFVTTY